MYKTKTCCISVLGRLCCRTCLGVGRRWQLLVGNWGLEIGMYKIRLLNSVKSYWIVNGIKRVAKKKGLNISQEYFFTIFNQQPQETPRKPENNI